jgi:hypothetical protein
MNVVFHTNTLLLAFVQSSHTAMYAPVVHHLAPCLVAKYSLIGSGI